MEIRLARWVQVWKEIIMVQKSKILKRKTQNEVAESDAEETFQGCLFPRHWALSL